MSAPRDEISEREVGKVSAPFDDRVNRTRRLVIVPRATARRGLNVAPRAGAGGQTTRRGRGQRGLTRKGLLQKGAVVDI